MKSVTRAEQAQGGDVALAASQRPEVNRFGYCHLLLVGWIGISDHVSDGKLRVYLRIISLRKTRVYLQARIISGLLIDESSLLMNLLSIVSLKLA
jgi:hypothetical protein